MKLLRLFRLKKKTSTSSSDEVSSAETQQKKHAQEDREVASIAPGKLVIVRSMAGVMAMPTDVNRVIKPDETLYRNEWRLVKFPIGSVLFCVEYEHYKDLNFRAVVLWRERTYDVYGSLGDFEILSDENLDDILSLDHSSSDV